MKTDPVTVGRKIIRLGESLGLTQGTLGDLLGVERGTVSVYKARPNANPSQDKVLRLVDQLVKRYGFDSNELLAWINNGENDDPPEIKTSRQTSTVIDYNGSDEFIDERWNAVVEASEAFATPRFVTVRVPVGKGAEVWKVSEAERTEMKVPGFAVAGGRMLVRVKGESLGRKWHHVVLGFEPDDYPYTGVYLLCSSDESEDVCSIRYIDPADSGRMLLSPDPQIVPVSLADWSVLGFAILEIVPRPGGQPPEVHFVPQGFGPGRDPNIKSR